MEDNTKKKHQTGYANDYRKNGASDENATLTTRDTSSNGDDDQISTNENHQCVHQRKGPMIECTNDEEY
ncbi:19502_t:CDS:2 [Gigaspora rosea]|nr:19502_t:CDS:2 [Gigaspora rosea]